MASAFNVHNPIREWSLSSSQLPNSQCEAYNHQCCSCVDCILQIFLSSYRISLSFNQSFTKYTSKATTIGRAQGLMQKHFETLRPLLFYPKNTLPAASDHAGCCHGHGLDLHLLLRQFHFPDFQTAAFSSPPSISACSSSRVFSLGFVMGGRSFLLIGIEKGQSIFSTVLSDWLCNCKMLFFIKLLNISVIFKLTIFKSLL